MRRRIQTEQAELRNGGNMMTMKEYRTRRKADIDEIVADTTRCGIIGFAVAVLSAVVIKGLGGSIFTEQGITSFIFVIVMTVISVAFLIKCALVMRRQ
jgi:hypothetical protein